jgi:hypothetical protein
VTEISVQKLVTIYLNDGEYSRTSHGTVQQHLAEDLKNGWIVKTMVPVGSSVGFGAGGETLSSGGGEVKGWLAVLLEKLG